MLREGAKAGIALDGDADRALLVDEHGEVFDGDDVMAAMGAGWRPPDGSRAARWSRR